MRRCVASLCFFIFFGISSLGAVQLKERDVKTSMQEMLAFHVEYKEFDTLLARRALKIFIEQFDSERMYLLLSEIQAYLDPKEERLKAIVHGYRQEDFSQWKELHRLFAKAVERAQKIRQEVEAEILQGRASLESAPPMSYVNYALNEKELKTRMRKQLMWLASLEEAQGKAGAASKETTQKIFALIEKRFARLERSYAAVNSFAISEHNLSMHVLKAFARSLDAHTAYFSPEEALEMRTLLEKQFEGIGVVLREGIDGVVIQDTIKGGPAQRSGQILSGDVIIGIDGTSVEKDTYEDILKKMQGAGHKRIELTLSRTDPSGQKTIHKVTVAREKILMQEDRVRYSTEPFANGIIGKVILPSFYEGGGGTSCDADMREALRGLKKEGDLLGLVVDMRENSGGFLSQAVKVAGLFVSSGVIVISKYAQGEVQYLRDLDARSYYNGPLLILTSKASASAAEIVAQSLQDYGIALVIGDDRTYGKGTIQYQTITDPVASSFFKVTVGRYYTVSGRSTQIEGVIADITVPTFYSAYNIGERYLEYPLKSDRIPSVYVDPLSDVDQRNQKWFEQNYIPNLQKKLSLWTQMLPQLKKNSAYRLKNSKDYTLFLEALATERKGQKFSLTAQNNFGVDDLQMAEALNLIKDMILIRKK